MNSLNLKHNPFFARLAVTLLFFFSFSLHSSLAWSAVTELSIQDIRAMDFTVDEQLKDAGYNEDPNDLILDVTHIESTSDCDPCQLDFEIKTKNQGKNLWIAGAVLSSVFIQSGQLTYLRFKPNKNKFTYHIDLSAGGTHEYQNLSLTFDPHIGKWGLFAGVGPQLMRIKSDLLPTSPPILVPAGKAELGWQKSWGKNKRTTTTLKYNVSFTHKNYKYYMMREASLSVGILLIRK